MENHRNNGTEAHGAKRMENMAGGHASPFTIRLLDRHCHQMMQCPTAPICSQCHSFLFLYQGETLVETDSRQLLIRANECIAIPANTRFIIRYFKDCLGYMGSFSTDFLCASPLVTASFKDYAFLLAQTSHVCHFDHFRSSFVQILLERIYSESITVPQNDGIVRANLNSFLAEISAELEKSINKPLSSNSICNRFMELLFADNHKKLTVAEYAEKLNVTANHLNRTIKINTGKSVSNWIEDSLMLSAKMLLRSTDLTMSEIADRLGIADPSYFSRRFRLHEQISPTDYRKAIRRNG